jgi:hypothetical protein
MDDRCHVIAYAHQVRQQVHEVGEDYFIKIISRPGKLLPIFTFSFMNFGALETIFTKFSQWIYVIFALRKFAIIVAFVIQKKMKK